MLEPGGVSVVIPLFNKERYVGQAIESALGYRDGPLEVVVVNDGSTDRSREIVAAMGDNRITLIDQSNRGLSATRNAGIGAARHDLIALLDADDWWYEGHLENLMRLQRAYPEVAMFSNNFTRFGRPALDRRFFQPDPLVLSPTQFLDVMARRTPMNSSSVLLRRPAVMAVGGFRTDVRHGEDYAIFVRLGLRSGAVLSSFVGAGYRHVPGSMSLGRIWAPGGGMREISSILRADPQLPRSTLSRLEAVRARWALEYCSGALRRGHMATARRFLALSRGASGQRLARVARLVLCHLPAPVAQHVMMFVDRQKGRSTRPGRAP